MPFSIVRNDITRMHTDAIVNSTSLNPSAGSGMDIAIYEAAGFTQMIAAREKIGNIQPGMAAFTEGFNLPAKYVIHCIGPEWKGGNGGEEAILRSCYRNSLTIAQNLHCKSIAFPLISSGNNGYPKDQALKVALSEINKFLRKQDLYTIDEDSEMNVYLVVYDKKAFRLSKTLYEDIRSYIDSNYIKEQEEQALRAIYDLGETSASYIRTNKRKIIVHKQTSVEDSEENELLLTMHKPETRTGNISRDLESLLREKHETFSELLTRIIEERKLNKIQVYKDSNIDAKLFSKIIRTKNYVPKKKTVMALIIGLKLNLKDAETLMATAGYTFAVNNQMDLIVRYFVDKSNYDIFELESTLFSFTGKTLGNYC